jgi:hypothetical protein
VMAMSVKRRIERNLPTVMGQRDPEAMIRVRSTDPIRASGLVPRQQAGHMTASDYTRQNAIKPLPAGGHPHMTGWGYESLLPSIGINRDTDLRGQAGTKMTEGRCQHE